MHCTYSACWLPLLEDRCAQLEALCEGWVMALQVEMADEDGKRKEEFPCCVKCAGMCFCPVPGMLGVSGEKAPISETQRAALKRARGDNDINVSGGPKSLRIKGAKELARSKNANALELAAYQCATERFRGKECYVAVDYDADTGNVHAYVRYPEDGEMKNPQDMVTGNLSCSCGVGH